MGKSRMEIDYINVLKEVRNDPMLPQQIEQFFCQKEDRAVVGRYNMIKTLSSPHLFDHSLTKL